MTIENFGIICGVTLGLFGSVFSVVQFFYQRQKDREQAEKDREQAEREKAQAERDREQAEREKAQAERDREQAEREKAQAEREAQRDKAQAERDKVQDLKDRLTFLMQVIIDKDIPRESRQPFFDEYIAKGGNGTVVKFWLENK
ncbi:MAG: hypothetical protein Ta2A_14530 [Treponemataceae bacterium]|nr:MAG: hypothetical protein Ta2A_14530 [Treponemataceae bacterium]